MPRVGSNHRPVAYQANALPLSYGAAENFSASRRAVTPKELRLSVHAEGRPVNRALRGFAEPGALRHQAGWGSKSTYPSPSPRPRPVPLFKRWLLLSPLREGSRILAGRRGVEPLWLLTQPICFRNSAFRPLRHLPRNQQEDYPVRIVRLCYETPPEISYGSFALDGALARISAQGHRRLNELLAIE